MASLRSPPRVMSSLMSWDDSPEASPRSVASDVVASDILRVMSALLVGREDLVLTEDDLDEGTSSVSSVTLARFFLDEDSLIAAPDLTLVEVDVNSRVGDQADWLVRFAIESAGLEDSCDGGIIDVDEGKC